MKVINHDDDYDDDDFDDDDEPKKFEKSEVCLK